MNEKDIQKISGKLFRRIYYLSQENLNWCSDYFVDVSVNISKNNTEKYIDFKVRLTKLSDDIVIFDVLDEKNSRIVFRVQFDYFFPTLVENHLTKEFLERMKNSH